MATTVTTAFNDFLANTINLDPGVTKKARSSRDWLVGKIHKFPEQDTSFPALYSEMDIYYGSFARHTKIRELDDIDIMICLNAQGSYYNGHIENINISVLDSATTIKILCFDGTTSLNSRKVINKYISLLRNVPQYEKAEMKRNQEAATLKLSSYDWNFDIVPCFFTKPDIYGRTYYLIPDGKGYWKKTDPRIDRQRVTNINQKCEGSILQVIRMLKYWNRRSTAPSMRPYLIENMIVDYYSKAPSVASKLIEFEIPRVLDYIRANVFLTVNDPKNIQGDLNLLGFDERQKISNRAEEDCKKAYQAIEYERQNEHRLSIGKWGDIFGPEFPTYG